MKTPKMIRVLVYVTVLGCWLSVSAMAQSPKAEENVAAISTDSAEIKWQPQVEYARIILTVSTPGGEVFRKEFEVGTVPSFKLFDAKGFKLPDGQYVYELRVVPNLSREVKEALAASRENDNSAEVIQELQRSGKLPKTITVQSGSFLVLNGAALAGGPEEPAGAIENAEPGKVNELKKKKKKEGDGTITIQDVVTPDDVIIQGSACIGLDCVNNENFGFDTIRLKENNTRIKFDDTSTSAGFPANDWQLTANDSASGGQSKFSIEDITGARVPFTVEAGATTNSVYIDSTGRIGFRTSTPVLDLHVATSNTPAARLEQNNAGGFTAQTWDVAGNEANFFVRDVTGGSLLPFRIRPGAPTSSIDISASGNVGIGTASPGFKVQVDTATATGTGGNTIADGLTLRSNNGINGVQLMHGVSTAFVALNPDSLGSGALGIGTKGNFPVHFYANSGLTAGTPSATGIRMTILGNGNVGIGTTTPAGKLDVNGTIFQRGVLLHADYVFEPNYELESIEDHTAFMWENKHLPAVGARKVDEQGREVVEIGARMRGLLEELEKAHIYISTLNTKVTERDEQLAKLAQQNAELAERLARIEALVSASKSSQK